MKVVKHYGIHVGELLVLVAWSILVGVVQAIFDFGSWITVVAVLGGLIWGGLWIVWMMNRHPR